MGIKGLWTFLAPYSEKKPLQQVKGETLAVDLSGWICDSQNVSDHFAQPKLYLRNLFFRTSYLLLSEITPVFVLEGEAPSMKQDIMANRNLLQNRMYSRNKKTNTSKKPDTKRKRFGNILNQCENLLNSMGVQCIRGKGEAEAMCAHLNSIGFVDAVISQDSDSFAYGAIKVYRNFSVSNSGCNSANSGSVEVYDMLKICKTIDFGRNKIAAMALLCGSDYNVGGVEGVGHSTALSFLMQHKDNDIINRLKSWTKEPDKFQRLASTINDSSNCSDCGHTGNIRNHQKLGCRICQTSTSCDKSKYREQRLLLKNELVIRSKAINNNSDFPDTRLIEEFLCQSHEVPPDFSVDWKKPDLIKFVKIMTKSLAWTESYCVEKFLPLLTRWQLINIINSKRISSSSISTELLHPDCIIKKRNPKGVPCYEVLWTDPEDLYVKIITDEQVEDEENFKKLWTTIERQDLMEKAYPNIVKKYLDSTKKTSKCKAKKNEQENKITAYIKLDKEIETLNKSLQKMNVDNVKPKRKRKNLEASFNTSIKNKKLRKRLNKNGLVQKNLDSFMKVKKNVNLMETNDKILNNSIAGKNYLNSSLNNSSIIFPDNLTFNSDYSEAELSNIVQNIIFDKSLHKKANNCKSQEYYNSTPIKIHSPSNVLLKSSFSVAGISQKKCKKRISHFFDHLSNDVDEFERSLDLKRNSLENCVNDISSDSSENLKENLFEDFNCLNTSKNIQTPVSSKTGSPVYTPLCERIKKYNLLKQ